MSLRTTAISWLYYQLQNILHNVTNKIKIAYNIYVNRKIAYHILFYRTSLAPLYQTTLAIKWLLLLQIVKRPYVSVRLQLHSLTDSRQFVRSSRTYTRYLMWLRMRTWRRYYSWRDVNKSLNLYIIIMSWIMCQKNILNKRCWSVFRTHF